MKVCEVCPRRQKILGTALSSINQLELEVSFLSFSEDNFYIWEKSCSVQNKTKMIACLRT